MNRTEHLLVCLMEECSEVQKAAAKALRFGLDDKEPGQEQTNAERINDESMDMISIMEMLTLEGALARPNNQDLIEAHRRKKTKVERFMRYAEERGTIGPAGDA